MPTTHAPRGTLAPGSVSPVRTVPAHIPRPEYVGRDHERLGASDVKDLETIERIRAAGRIAAQALAEVGRHVEPGVTTDELDRIGHEFLCDHGAYPSTLHYQPHPNQVPYLKSLCTSVNEVICHGVPDSTVLAEGDLVKVDITAYLDGVHGDNVRDVLGRRGRRGVQAARRADPRGDDARHQGRRTGPRDQRDRSGDRAVRARGSATAWCATSPATASASRSTRASSSRTTTPRPTTTSVIEPGMVFTIEPMLNLGTPDWEMWDDGWTVVTADRRRSAQFEHTLVVTETGAEILTLP